MKQTTTDGREIYTPDICSCCQQDTAGNHEWDCPNNDSFIGCLNNKEADMAMVKIKSFRMRFDKDLKERQEKFL